MLLGKNPLEDIRNVASVKWVMQNGRLWRPWQLRSGIAARNRSGESSTGEPEPALTHPGSR